MHKPNEIRTIGSIAYMALYDRNNNVVDITLFDKKFVDKVKEFRWCRYKHRYTAYVSTTLTKDKQKEYGKIKLKIYQLFLKYETPLMIDHINHDGLDNRLENLRIVTNRTNCENKRIRCKSGYTGIRWHNRDKIWFGTISVNGTPIHTGNFKTKEEAVKARELYKLKNKL